MLESCSVNTKICNFCKEMKPLSEFNQHKSNPDNLQYQCKECQSILCKQYKSANSESISEYNRKYREANKEKIRSYYKLSEVEKYQNILDNKIKFFNIFKTLVEKRGGVCRSSLIEYENAHNKLQVKCQNGHPFSICLNNLKKNRWCPTCNTRLGELISIRALEHLFGKKFIKIRPEWLKNEEGFRLELDGYNEELKLAIEYNGLQHYKNMPHFFRTQEEFDKRKRDDAVKSELCGEHGVNLIVVPYNIHHHKICKFITNECMKLGYKFVKQPEDFDLNSCINNMDSQLEILNNLITSKGGKLISGNYTDRESEITVQCDKGHEWTTKIRYIRSGSWCHVCAREQTSDRRKSISQGMKQYLATEDGIRKKEQSFIKRSQTMQQQREQIRATIQNKRCSKCTEIKDINKFNKKSYARDGYQPYCKKCINDIKKVKRN